MKTKILFSVLLSGLWSMAWAQDRTTVNATNSEISDNLDLRAVASIFGDAQNLEDFERRLNDPKTPISNLDLNQDNQVDYLRVIESVEGNQHIIVLQAVLGRDQYQDVATVEVEKDPRTNRIQVQVVGDVYMYGSNYIYEPVYVNTPVIYNYFWTPYYRPYCSTWYWGYYPSYYYAWNPFPIFRYRHHIGLCINFNYYYNYVNYRRCHVAYTHYYGRRCNYFERRYPDRAFATRNQGITNRYELDRTRPVRNVAYPDTRDALAGTREGNTPRGNSGIRATNNGSLQTTGGVRGNWTSASSPRPVREETNSNSNPRPRITEATAENVTAAPRPVRSNSITSGSPRPSQSEFAQNTVVASPRPVRTNYTVTPQESATVRGSSYNGSIRSNTVTNYEAPRPTRSESVTPKPNTAYVPNGGVRQYTPSSTPSSGGRQYQSSTSQNGGRSAGNVSAATGGRQGRSAGDGRR